MTIFVLEDDNTRMQHLGTLLQGGDLLTRAVSCADIGSFDPPYDLILLDHDLGGRQMEHHEDSGLAFARLIKDQINPDAVVVVHSYNPNGAARMVAELSEHNAVYAPFGGREWKAIIERTRGALQDGNV